MMVFLNQHNSRPYVYRSYNLTLQLELPDRFRSVKPVIYLVLRNRWEVEERGGGGVAAEYSYWNRSCRRAIKFIAPKRSIMLHHLRKSMPNGTSVYIYSRRDSNKIYYAINFLLSPARFPRKKPLAPEKQKLISPPFIPLITRNKDAGD